MASLQKCSRHSKSESCLVSSVAFYNYILLITTWSPVAVKARWLNYFACE